MRMVVGIFDSQAGATEAFRHLRSAGIAADKISLLAPGDAAIEEVPTTETEQPGVGTAIGGLMGATGAMAGWTAAQTLLLPGLGLVTATGLAATAVLAGLGAAGGAAIGGAVEESLQHGLPIDELYVYEDALRQGRAVILVETENKEQADQVREIMAAEDAESIDAAREQWWTGLRSAEKAEYETPGRNFGADEEEYRQGFEVAQLPKAGGKPYSEARDYLRECYPRVYEHAPFREGYERGRQYRAKRLKQTPISDLHRH
jgi:hypothetical protein